MEAKDFIATVMRGDEAAARDELARDPALAKAHTEQGVSVICMAVYRQLPALAAALAAQRDDIDLFESACLGDRERVAQRLAEQPQALNTASPDGFSVLGFSAFFGHVELLRDLLARGADVHASSRNAMKVQPLHSAAAQSDPVKAAELGRMLLAAGADPNAKQQAGYAPLHEAALNGNLPLVEALLAHGADPTLGNDKGETALELARSKGQLAVASRLEEALAGVGTTKRTS
ncbi:MAG TPA: ankyrin repeat domain-containing protein [Polyangiales bacterium]|nr:ankyrin repeat domain-containing protein [Polyangiales bacterium]